MTWLIVGLGNPGTKYERNRHNIGFRVVDEFARRSGLPAWRATKLGAESSSGTVAGTKVVIIKPQEFMNLSGFATRRALDFHHISPKHLIVVHDEIDLDFGVIRLKQDGGHGGHNGLRSIIEQLGLRDFARLRVGVGRDPNKPPGSKEAASWVLSDFSRSQDAEINSLISISCDCIEAVLKNGMTAAMNQHNGRSTEPTS